ncbi:hypothetical protein F2P44_10330 [Massilia sp. CCM 8695]|uniref:Integral membrane protein n=1 Tax=Massilia frigida TaxID=2609281 RepID=A0ABX0NAP5_9BURK|nr:hypothetical protein [Massilia frigida]NHZ79672.1 hypothetical protein [Massilia frigida]
MTTPENPYTPPASMPARRVSSRMRQCGYALGLLVAAHLLAAIMYGSDYVALASTGAVSSINLFASTAAGLCLYIGTLRLLRLLREGGGGRVFFIVAVGGFVMSLRGWWTFGDASMLVISGIGLAAAGAWLAHLSQQQLRDAELR